MPIDNSPKCDLNLIDECLKHCDEISINDGEEDILLSNDASVILCMLNTTGEDTIDLMKDGECIGFFFLVYGNGDDGIICDYSSNDICDAIFNAVE